MCCHILKPANNGGFVPLQIRTNIFNTVFPIGGCVNPRNRKIIRVSKVITAIVQINI